MSSFKVDTYPEIPQHFPESYQICQAKFSGAMHTGIWHGYNPLKFGFPLLMCQIILAFFLSSSIYFLLRPLKQTRFVCSVLAGIILGPSVISHNDTIKAALFPRGQSIVLNTLSSLSLVYFIFITSLKMDSAMIFRTAHKAWKISLACVGAPAVFCGAAIWMFKDNLPENRRSFHAFFDAGISLSYFPVIAHSLHELNLLSSELGQLAMSSAMFSEIFSWVIRVAAMTKRQGTLKDAMGALTSVFVMIAICLYGIRPMVLQINKRTPEGKAVNQIYVVIIFLCVGFSAFLCDMIGSFYINGPLILGLIIPAGSPLSATLVEKSEFIATEFLLPVFFINIGIHTDVYAIKGCMKFWSLLFVVGLSYVAKIGGTMTAAVFLNMRVRNAFVLGLMMNTKGAIDLILYRRWSVLKYVSDQGFSLLVILALTVTVIATPLIQILYKPNVRFSSSHNSHIKSIQTSPPTAELRILSCVHATENVHSMITLLEASNPTQHSPICIYVIHLIELVGRATPFLLPHKKLCRLSNNTDKTTYQIMRAFENYSKNSFGPVSIQPFTMVAPYKTMHENICRLAEDKLISLILVPFQENQRILANCIQNLNMNVQTYASCTVGILVDRGLRCKIVNNGYFSYHVAVLFLGGADDREVLAYGGRMSGHLGVSITVMRIIMLDKKTEDLMEKELDDAAFDEFRLITMNNVCVVCREVEVKDSVEAMEAIQSLESSYDLVMVGRRHESLAVFDDEMAEWTENKELGVIGDILASPDFFRGMMSVLVMQLCSVEKDRNCNESLNGSQISLLCKRTLC